MRLAIRGGNQRLKRDMQGLRFLAWHAVAPHAGKKFPDLATFMGGGSGERRPQPGVDIDTSLRKWRAVMAAGQARTPPRKPPERSILG